MERPNIFGRIVFISISSVIIALSPIIFLIDGTLVVDDFSIAATIGFIMFTTCPAAAAVFLVSLIFTIRSYNKSLDEYNELKSEKINEYSNQSRKIEV